MHKLKIDNRRYIGITSQKPSDRWNNGKGYKRNSYFWRAIRKYSWSNFEHVILFTDLSKKQACDKEKALIKLFNTQDQRFGFNISEGGELPKVTKETREKISRTATKYQIDNDLLTDLYINKNLSMKEIAKYFGCSYSPIYNRLHKLGIVKSKNLKKQQIKEKRTKFNISQNDFYHIYIELNYTKQEAANYFGCSASTILNVARKYGIKKSVELTKQNVSKGHLKHK